MTICPLVIATCCREWPVCPVLPMGRCGLCGNVPMITREAVK